MKRTAKAFLAAILAAILLAGMAGAVPALAAAKTVKTTKLTLSEDGTVKLTVGEKKTIKATVKPKNSTQKVKWSSSDEKVATVSGKGVVKAKGAGTATITAKSGGKKAKVKVKVSAKTVKTTKLTLSQTKTIKLTVGGKKTVKATVKPKDSTQKVKWSSSDEKVATVSGKGVIKAKGVGTATITARSGSKKAKVKVEVSEKKAVMPDPDQGKTLVAYFSCTGTTEGVAKKLARVTDADLYRIVPEVAYTEEDLDYGDSSTRATWEQDHPETRPALGGKDIDLKGYTTLYLGYPIWWGMEPRIMCTFVEKYDFTGITVIPFCTSGSSGIGDSGADLARLAKAGKWLNGARHSAGITEDALRDWVKSLK